MIHGLKAIGNWAIACENEIGRKILPINLQHKWGIQTEVELNQSSAKIARLDVLERLCNAISGASTTIIAAPLLGSLVGIPVQFLPLVMPAAGAVAGGVFARNSNLPSRLLYAVVTAVAVATAIFALAGGAVTGEALCAFFIFTLAGAHASLAILPLSMLASRMCETFKLLEVDVAERRNGGYRPNVIQRTLDGKYSWG